MGMTYWLEKAEADVRELTVMDRRRFLLTSLAGVVVARVAAAARQAGKVYRAVDRGRQSSDRGPVG
jgi:hypothetical protein